MTEAISVDDQVDKITKTLLNYIPKSIIPFCISWFMWAMNFSQSVYNQARKTTNAITQSFQNDTIYFLKSADNIAISEKSFFNIYELANKYEWQYIPHKKFFIKKTFETSKPRKSPWFSAELFSDELMISDITEWLEELRFHCKKDEMPPIDILIQAWAIDHNRDLGSLNQYKLKVLNDMMETEEIPVKVVLS